ncbi:MAG TPA: sodium:proton antiporter [Polyangiaceae bacterium]|nr:sodium:proton antiporter [Polyangiaceae bacterium]
MSGFELASTIICLAAGLGYINARLLRLPSAIALMAMGLLGSFMVVGLNWLGVISPGWVEGLVARVDFGNVLMHELLGLMLFAGALHIDLAELSANRWSVAALALGGTIISTVLVGVGTYGLMASLRQDISWGEAFLFGALISPTDPIAVLGILKSAKVPRELSLQIGGESLFNDGVGVVLFLVIAAVSNGAELGASQIVALFAREALGGALFGFLLGYLGFRLLRSIDDYSTEVLITLALVVGGYASAERLHVSAPIAAVVAGLVIGNQGRRLAMSDQTREHVDMFWRLIDEILNAVLFLMLGLEATRLHWNSIHVVLAAILVIPVALLARLLSVATPVSLLRLRRSFAPHAVKILTWGGLRGGISVALALSLPPGKAHDVIVLLTYAVVTFSVLVQGLSLGRLLRHLRQREDSRVA